MQDINRSSESPAIRLAASRKALFRQMTPRNVPLHSQTTGDSSGYGASLDANLRVGNNSILQLGKQAITGWWKYHPAHMAVDAGLPYLASYARNKPWHLLGLAAGAGALAVFVKPWRLVSMTGLAVTALKSSNLPASVLSFLANAQDTPQEKPIFRQPKETS